MRTFSPALVCLLVVFQSIPALAQLRRVNFVSGLTQPVAFVQDPADPTVQFVVQQTGVVRTVRSGVLQTTPFLDVHTIIRSGGEQGLLGMAFPLDAATSGRFFVDFTDVNGDTVVARFKRSTANPLVADPASRFDLGWSTGERVIRQPFANHNGGTLAFGPDSYLYIGMGDGGDGDDPSNHAQNMGSLLGKMLRIDVAVSDSDPAGQRIPADNPFPTGAAPEIWDIGVRNPWKFSFDDPWRDGTGALIIADVGQGAWEEVDYEAAGRGGNNYGWRNREGAHDHITSVAPAFLPLTDPVFEYPHPTGFSITGGYVYRGSALGAAYRGRYFFADYVAARIWSIALTVDPSSGVARASDLREHTAELTPGNVSAFGVDAAGELYYVDYGNGAVVRIAAAPAALVPAMSIDLPTRNQTVLEPFPIAGWAIDPASTVGAGIDALHVWAYPLSVPGGAVTGAPAFVGATFPTLDRPDVAAAFGSSQFTRSGFVLGAAGLLPGVYRFAVFAHVARTGSFDGVRAVDVTIAPSVRVAVDSPRPSSPVGTSFVVAGWAIDPAAPGGAGIDAIHVWALPASGTGGFVFLGAAPGLIDRPDVGAIFGARFTTSGYSFVVNAPPPGTWNLYVFARSTATSVFQASAPIAIVR